MKIKLVWEQNWRKLLLINLSGLVTIKLKYFFVIKSLTVGKQFEKLLDMTVTKHKKKLS